MSSSSESEGERRRLVKKRRRVPLVKQSQDSEDEEEEEEDDDDDGEKLLTPRPGFSLWEARDPEGGSWFDVKHVFEMPGDVDHAVVQWQDYDPSHNSTLRLSDIRQRSRCLEFDREEGLDCWVYSLTRGMRCVALSEAHALWFGGQVLDRKEEWVTPVITGVEALAPKDFVGRRVRIRGRVGDVVGLTGRDMQIIVVSDDHTSSHDVVGALSKNLLKILEPVSSVQPMPSL